MNEYLLPYLFSKSTSETEYYNLTEKEKNDVDFVNSCLYSDNEKLSNAAFYIMLLVLEISDNSNDFEPEEVQMLKEKIYKDLSYDEQVTMNKFMLACINTMGIYSDEAKIERKLKKERNDLNGKS